MDDRSSLVERFRLFLARRVFWLLNGITLKDWWRLLRSIGFAVGPAYLPRAGFVTVVSAFNSFHTWRERKRFGAAVDETRVKPPIFILGHYRSGTTYVHYLLAQDQRFAYPNVYQVEYPNSFLTTEGQYQWLVDLLTIRKRPMDDVRISPTTPNEDELALCTLTLMSPYMSLIFPRCAERFDRYLTFRKATSEERQTWMRAFQRYLRKLSLRYGRPLVLKSPPHTGRVRMLLEMFPNARFIHIHRDPYTVYQSTLHLVAKLGPLFHLQRPRPDGDGVIRRYKEMYDAFFEDVGSIPAGQFAEIRFATLERNPIGEMRRVYAELDLGDFDSTEVSIRRYVDSLAGFRKNRFHALDPALRAKIASAWRRCFETWGYPV